MWKQYIILLPAGDASLLHQILDTMGLNLVDKGVMVRPDGAQADFRDVLSPDEGMRAELASLDKITDRHLTDSGRRRREYLRNLVAVLPPPASPAPDPQPGSGSAPQE